MRLGSSRSLIDRYSRSGPVLSVGAIALLLWLAFRLWPEAVLQASGVARAIGLFHLWHPVPRLVADIEVLTAVVTVLAAGIATVLVPRVSQFLTEARECRRNEARLLAATENSLDAFYILKSVRGEDGQIADFEFTYLNHNGERLIGRSREQILGAHLCVLLPINRTGGFFEDYARVVLSGEPIVHEFPLRPEQETTRWIRHQVVRLDDGVAITASDVTQRKHSEQRAQPRMQLDLLTGLPHRGLLHDRLGQAMERADRYQQKVAVFLVDLDAFQQINDTLGHLAGDLVLITVANRLREAVRATDSVLRIGGDEFLVVMPDVDEERDIPRSAEKLLAALGRVGPSGLEHLALACSVGVSIYPTLARSATELMARADRAMHQAKYRGGNCFEVCSGEGLGPYPQAASPDPGRRQREVSLLAARRFQAPPSGTS
jgi:diguanylate cyclase (GGDEF)-like protein